MTKKTPNAVLRAARAQIRRAREEGEIETPAERKIVYAEGVEAPGKKRTVKRSARAQVRANGGGASRVRSYPYVEGDLVQIHKVLDLLPESLRCRCRCIATIANATVTCS